MKPRQRILRKRMRQAVGRYHLRRISRILKEGYQASIKDLLPKSILKRR